jgi:hypothetical protein
MDILVIVTGIIAALFNLIVFIKGPTILSGISVLLLVIAVILNIWNYRRNK